jgi:hypothetical protein
MTVVFNRAAGVSPSGDRVFSLIIDDADDPTVDRDETEDFAVGDRWINLSNNAEFTCFDATTGAAVWLPSGGSVISAPRVYAQPRRDSIALTGNPGTDQPIPWTAIFFESTPAQFQLADTNTTLQYIGSTRLDFQVDYGFAYRTTADEGGAVELQAELHQQGSPLSSYGGISNVGDGSGQTVFCSGETTSLSANDKLSLEIDTEFDVTITEAFLFVDRLSQP